MKAILGVFYVTECGRTEQDPRLAAVLDVEYWIASQNLSVGELKAAEHVLGHLDEYPDLVVRIMDRYHSALGDAAVQAQALQSQSPGLSD